MMKKLIILLVLTISFLLSTVAQDTDSKVSNYLSFSPQFFQIKDKANYGLVHSGLNLAGEYRRISENATHTKILESELSFGINYRQGLGMVWSFKPVDFFFGWKIRDDQNLSLVLGLYGAIHYQWNLYPELQSGHLFWLSSFEVGPQLIMAKPIGERALKVTISSSALNANSRPDVITEEYFYSLKFSDFVKNPHTNIKLGSLDLFSHLNLEIELLKPDKKFSLAYEFDYMSFEGTTSLEYLSHSLNLKWRIGREK